jgi:hypothetical protein
VAKSKPISEEVQQRVITALEKAWEAGSPMAGSQPEYRAEMADVCLRRYGSRERRGVNATDREAVVRDLSVGMIQAFETSFSTHGAIWREYYWLADQVLKVIERHHQGTE